MVKPIHVGDPARVWLIEAAEVIRGHVESLARDIGVRRGSRDAR